MNMAHGGGPGFPCFSCICPSSHHACQTNMWCKRDSESDFCPLSTAISQKQTQLAARQEHMAPGFHCFSCLCPSSHRACQTNMWCKINMVQGAEGSLIKEGTKSKLTWGHLSLGDLRCCCFLGCEKGCKKSASRQDVQDWFSGRNLAAGSEPESAI